MQDAINVVPTAGTPGTPPSLLEKLEQEAKKPTQSAEAAVAQLKADFLAELEAKAFHWIARGREVNIELGRVFNQIKALLGHGEWEPYYETTFASKSVALRTAQEYMRMAREADELTKNANSALFPSATYQQATAVTGAVEQAKAAVAQATANEPAPAASAPNPTQPKAPRKSRVRLDGLYHLPLYLTGDQKDNLDALRKPQNWLGAELAIRATIDRVLVQYGYVNEPGADEDAADTEGVDAEESEYETTLA